MTDKDNEYGNPSQNISQINNDNNNNSQINNENPIQYPSPSRNLPKSKKLGMMTQTTLASNINAINEPIKSFKSNNNIKKQLFYLPKLVNQDDLILTSQLPEFSFDIDKLLKDKITKMRAEKIKSNRIDEKEAFTKTCTDKIHMTDKKCGDSRFMILTSDPSRDVDDYLNQPKEFKIKHSTIFAKGYHNRPKTPYTITAQYDTQIINASKYYKTCNISNNTVIPASINNYNINTNTNFNSMRNTASDSERNTIRKCYTSSTSRFSKSKTNGFDGFSTVSIRGGGFKNSEKLMDKVFEKELNKEKDKEWHLNRDLLNEEKKNNFMNKDVYFNMNKHFNENTRNKISEKQVYANTIMDFMNNQSKLPSKNFRFEKIIKQT